MTNRVAGLKGYMMMTTRKRKWINYFLTGVAAVLWSGTTAAGSVTYPVIIQTPEGRQSTYQLELAVTPAARKQGLMNRQHLTEGEGMLFVWPKEDNRFFWMKDTSLSLDILFFSHEKLLVASHKNTEPFSVERLPSGKPAQYVVELKAGQAQLQGLKLGSLLVLPIALMHALSR